MGPLVTPSPMQGQCLLSGAFSPLLKVAGFHRCSRLLLACVAFVHCHRQTPLPQGFVLSCHGRAFDFKAHRALGRGVWGGEG